MGQTARLRLIRDRFISGHSSCELRRHLDSVPPETPIRDVVDRCRVWESHADPAVRQVSKPSTDLTYPAYVVGDADRNSENTRVAAVTGQRSGMTQLEVLLRRFLGLLRRFQRQRPARRDWSDVVCFSCGKSGHAAHDARI